MPMNTIGVDFPVHIVTLRARAFLAQLGLVAEQHSGLCAKHNAPLCPLGRVAGVSRSLPFGAFRLQGRLGESSEFLAQRWRAVEIKQALVRPAMGSD
jgi:hypothetical protein